MYGLGIISGSSEEADGFAIFSRSLSSLSSMAMFADLKVSFNICAELSNCLQVFCYTSGLFAVSGLVVQGGSNLNLAG